MSVTVKNFPTILSDLKASMVTNGSRFTDLEVGSRIYALLTAVASGLSEGWMTLADVQDVYYVTTASGVDLDRRVEDVGLRRNPGTKASGGVLAYSSVPITIPNGTILKLADGSVMMEVIQTKTITPPFTSLPVVVTEVGTKGNLAAGTNLLDYLNAYQSITFKVGSLGVDEDDVPIGRLSGGTNKESDSALRARFVDYLKSLSRSTLRSVRAALLQITGIGSLVLENATPVPGYVTISLSDGTGSISESLAAAVAEVMDEYAAAGIGYVLKSIDRREFAIEVTVFTKDITLSPASIQAAVSSKLTELGQNLALGDSVYRSELIYAAFIDGLENVTVQQPATDQIAEPSELLGISSIVVNVQYI
jgi:uncharacterized phage protein gp47/JayE